MDGLQTKNNPLIERQQKLKECVKTCCKCICCVIFIALLLIAIGSLLLFTPLKDLFNSNRHTVSIIGISLLSFGIFVLMVSLLSICCGCCVFMRIERKVNNPEPFIPPTEGYPKQQYKQIAIDWINWTFGTSTWTRFSYFNFH